MQLKDKILKSLEKLKSEPILLLTVPFALILFIPIIILSPIILIRFGFFHSDRLGHFAVNSEIFFCENQYVKINNRLIFDCFYFPTKPCNDQLGLMISRKVSIYPKIFIRPFCLISRNIFFLSKHVTGRSSNSDYDTNHVLDKTKLQINLTKNEVKRGEKILKKLKLKNNKIICVGVRDNSYLKKKYKNQNFSYHDHRNDEITKYVLGIRYLLKKGYTVFRMGSITSKKIKINHKNFLDYSNSRIKSDFMDVYISYVCKLFISNNTGLDALAVTFRKPILHIGSLPFGAISTFSNRYFNTMSNYFSLEKKRFLRLTEIFDKNIQYLWKKEDFKNKNIKIVHPTKKDIFRYFIETINIIEKPKRAKKHLLLEKKFKDLYSRYVKKNLDGKKYYHNNIKTKILFSFLNTNRHLLK